MTTLTSAQVDQLHVERSAILAEIDNCEMGSPDHLRLMLRLRNVDYMLIHGISQEGEEK